MKKNLTKLALAALAISMPLAAVGCKKAEAPEAPKVQTSENEKKPEEKTNDTPMVEDEKPEVTESVTEEEAGMTQGESEKFKPSDYTLAVKDEYVYEFLGLKFNLSDDIKKAMEAKEVAMLDDQSPTDQDLKYAMLTFSTMTEEQRNAEIDKMGDGYPEWQESLARLGTISMVEKDMPEEEVTKLTKCSNNEKLGSSKDDKYDYYLSTNGEDSDLLKAFKDTKVEIIDRKDRPENGFVLAEKSDLENTEAYTPEEAGSLKDIETKDINGKEFTGKNFADAKLTMVNVFATWCTACIKEIPDLVQVQEEMKDKGVNIVGIVTDTVDDNGENQDAIEKSKVIAEKTKANYPFLMPDETQFHGRLVGIQALPETFFVDSEGNIVGETQSGARDAEGWKALIEEQLSKMQ